MSYHIKISLDKFDYAFKFKQSNTNQFIARSIKKKYEGEFFTEEPIFVKITLIERKKKMVEGQHCIETSNLVALTESVLDSLQYTCFQNLSQVAEIRVVRLTGLRKALEIEVIGL
jgi:hypothetical protein